MSLKHERTMEVFDEYERRLADARAKKPRTHPWEKADREKILEGVKKMLRWDDALVPEIRDVEEIARADYDGYHAIAYRYRTWDRFYGASTLYMPSTDEKVPLVFVCCGHGQLGRANYSAMGHRLASLGIAALVIENIGQGDRSKTYGTFMTPEHWFPVAPFYCGLTLQGMIVMETVALIRHMAKDPRFLSDRLGACGNSGGGTLTMFLSALAPELCVISSSGYPSEICYILSKERRHCACNLLEGAAHGPEMWEIYSLFAPKPLLLEGGEHDDLIPSDLAHKNARKVKNTYLMLGSDRFRFKLTDTRHSWELTDINLISSFLSEHLLGTVPDDAKALTVDPDPALFRVPMPSDMLSTDELAETLSGKTMPAGTRLCDVYVPPVKESEIDEGAARGDIMRVFAQMECLLKK